MKGALQRLLLPTTRVPALNQAYRKGYEVCRAAALEILRRDPGVEAVVMRSSFDNPYFRPATSDIDLLVVVTPELSRDLEAMWRLRRRMDRLSRVMPILQPCQWVSRFDVEEYENDCVHQYVALDDAVVLHGDFDRARLSKLYSPHTGLSGLTKAIWAYFTVFHRWLFAGARDLPSWNWHKVFLKPLVFVGYRWSEAAELVDAVVPTSDFSVRSRVACFVAITAALKAKLRTHAFFEGASARRGLSRSSRGGISEPEIERASQLARRLSQALRKGASFEEVVVGGSSAGPGSLMAHVVLSEVDWRADNIERAVASWREAQRSDPYVASSLYSCARAPILVDREMLDYGFATDISRRYWLLDAFGPREGMHFHRANDLRALGDVLANTEVRLGFISARPDGMREEIEHVIPITLAQITTGEAIFDPHHADAVLRDEHPAIYRCLLAARRLLDAPSFDRVGFHAQIQPALDALKLLGIETMRASSGPRPNRPAGPLSPAPPRSQL